MKNAYQPVDFMIVKAVSGDRGVSSFELYVKRLGSGIVG